MAKTKKIRYDHDKVGEWKLMFMDVRNKVTIQQYEHKDGRVKVVETKYDADGNVLDVTIAHYDDEGLLLQ